MEMVTGALEEVSQLGGRGVGDGMKWEMCSYDDMVTWSGIGGVFRSGHLFVPVLGSS